MKTLVISKPIYDIIIPLNEFPKDGDNFYINESIKTMNSVGNLTAIALGKYGIETYYTGMIGEDSIGNKVKEILNKYNIDTKYVEVSYKEHSEVNYKIYNMKTNTFTNILENSIKTNLMKYKYEFIPDVIVMDDNDYGANMAAINNYPNANLIYISNKFTNESSVYLNKCKYVIANLSFATNATGIYNNLNKPKVMVSLFQKYIDMYKSNLIIRLDNFDYLYCVDDEVRIIKNVNSHLKNKENVFNSILIYFLINTNNIEESIKCTNKVMLESKNELDMILNIPDYEVVSNVLNEYKSRISNNKEINNSANNGVTNDNVNNAMTNTNNVNNVTSNNNVNNVSKETDKVDNVVSQNNNSSINNQTNSIETFDMPKNKIEDNNS